LAISRTVVPHPPTVNVNAEAAEVWGGLGAWMGLAGVVARSLVMIALAALTILVLLPAVVGAQV
jgi:hypothetical protein